VGKFDPRRRDGQSGQDGDGAAGSPRDAAAASGASQAEFLDRLMPFYPKALAYAQTLTGSLMDGEDLVSDAVLNAYNRFHQLRDRSKFREWFFAILLNRFRSLHSRQRLNPFTLVAGLTGAASRSIWESTARASGDPAELGYQLTLVKELLGRLHPQERDTLLLLGAAEFSIEEVARIQHCSPRAVIQRAYRARRKLQQMLPAGELPFLSPAISEETR
jgi:RNA polymerase sigma-70 factor (ECF subfamily)